MASCRVFAGFMGKLCTICSRVANIYLLEVKYRQPTTTLVRTARAPSPSELFALPRCALGLPPTAGAS